LSAFSVGEAAAPLLYDAFTRPFLDEVPEPIAAHGEELGTVVERPVLEAARRHPTSDPTTLVQHDYAPAGSRELAGGQQS
jgi:hypothetical protein